MKAAHIVSVSGGKDSTALYLKALERGRPFHAVFADTGNEHEWTYEAVRTLPEKTGGPPIQWVKADFTADFARKRAFVEKQWPLDGVPDNVVRKAVEVLAQPTGNPFLDLCILKGRFPGAKTRFCTDELKIGPMFDQVQRPRLDAGRAIFSWQGVRGEESLARRFLPKLQRIDPVPYSRGSIVRKAYSDARVWAYRPLIDWTVEDVWAMHERHGLARNPLYDHGMSRVGCMPCIMAKKGELREIAKRFPEHVDRIAQWEELVAATAKRGNATFFCASDDPLYQGEKIEAGDYGIRRRVEWTKTSRGGVQYDLMALADFNTSCDTWGACE